MKNEKTMTNKRKSKKSMSNNFEKIKIAIKNNKTSELEAIDGNSIEKFSYKGINAFTYACYYAKFETIKLIVIKMKELFSVKYQDLSERDDALFDFFYESFFDSEDKEYNPATILAVRSKGNTEDSKDAYTAFNYLTNTFTFFLNVSEIIRNTAISNGARAGFFTKNLMPRPVRSFTKERERQLIKQFSTILFFALKGVSENPKELIEIQTMHITLDNKSYLIVTANEVQTTAKFSELIKNKGNLKTILTKEINISHDVEGKDRVNRYTNNFKHCIFGKFEFLTEEDISNGEVEDVKKCKQIETLLNKDNNLQVINLTYSDDNKISNKSKKDLKAEFNKSEGQIIFLNTSTYSKLRKERHSEEFLVDIIEFLDEEKYDFEVCIGGKKRPCITCYGRMSFFNEKKSKNKIKFGEYPGLLWIKALDMQDKELQEKSKEILITQVSYATCDKDNKMKTNYDSGTDEEDQLDLKP